MHAKKNDIGLRLNLSRWFYQIHKPDIRCRYLGRSLITNFLYAKVHTLSSWALFPTVYLQMLWRLLVSNRLHLNLLGILQCGYAKLGYFFPICSPGMRVKLIIPFIRGDRDIVVFFFVFFVRLKTSSGVILLVDAYEHLVSMPIRSLSTSFPFYRLHYYQINIWLV